MLLLEEAVDTENIHLVKQALDSIQKLIEDIEIDSSDTFTYFSEFD